MIMVNGHIKSQTGLLSLNSCLQLNLLAHDLGFKGTESFAIDCQLFGLLD